MKILDQKPQVGIFEIIDNAVFMISRDVDKSKEFIGSDDAGEFFHKDLVRYCINECSDEAKKKYKSAAQGFLAFPRGRVWYDFKSNQYCISTCSEIAHNNKIIMTIVRKFSLPSNDVMVYIDSHYTL